MEFNSPTAAHQAVRRALAAGRLERQPCAECGALKVEAHHEDYAKPLDVIWLCRRCHSRRPSVHPSRASMPPARDYPQAPPPVRDASPGISSRAQMSISEAATILNVNRQRIHQLLKAGILTGEKSGAIWLIDRTSVEARLAAPRNRGGKRRPPRPAAAPEGDQP